MNETHIPYNRHFLDQLKSNLTDSAWCYITKLCKTQVNVNPNSALRFPLQLALLISPLCLLLPVNLDKKVFNRGALMQWSNHLRSRKPDVLQVIEKKLWKGILNIVNQPGDYLAILKTLASEFPPTYIDELRRESESMNDCYTFDIPSNGTLSSQDWNADKQASSSLQSASLPSTCSLPSLLSPISHPEISAVSLPSQTETSVVSLPSLTSQSNETTGNIPVPISQTETSVVSLPSLTSQANDTTGNNLVPIETRMDVDKGEVGDEAVDKEAGITADGGGTGGVDDKDKGEVGNQAVNKEAGITADGGGTGDVDDMDVGDQDANAETGIKAGGGETGDKEFRDADPVPISQPETSAVSLPSVASQANETTGNNPVPIDTRMDVDKGEVGDEAVNKEAGITADGGGTGGVDDMDEGEVGNQAVNKEAGITADGGGTGGVDDMDVGDQDANAETGIKAGGGDKEFRDADPVPISQPETSAVSLPSVASQASETTGNNPVPVDTRMDVDECGVGDHHDADRVGVHNTGKEMDVNGDAAHRASSGKEKDKGEVRDGRNESGIQEGMDVDEDGVRDEGKTTGSRRLRSGLHTSSNLSKSSPEGRPSYQETRKQPSSSRKRKRVQAPASTGQASSAQGAKKSNLKSPASTNQAVSSQVANGMATQQRNGDMVVDAKLGILIVCNTTYYFSFIFT
jgi:hypothetical protein